jgi:hypothetical protein
VCCCGKSNTQFQRKLDTTSRHFEACKLIVATRRERENVGERENSGEAEGNDGRDSVVVGTMFWVRMKGERWGFSAVEKYRGDVSFYRAREAAWHRVKEGYRSGGLLYISFGRLRGNRGMGSDGVVRPFQETTPLWSLNIYGMHIPFERKKKWNRNWREPEAIRWITGCSFHILGDKWAHIGSQFRVCMPVRFYCHSNSQTCDDVAALGLRELVENSACCRKNSNT